MAQHPQHPGQQPERQPPEAAPTVRASGEEREAAVRRLQMAFAEERLSDEEFEQRVQAALRAGTHADLDRLTADLPAISGARTPAAVGPAHRLTLAVKAAARRRGRWRVPERTTAVAYKGGCQLDLRAAELTAHVTTVRAFAYKSTVEILVPPGVRVETGGLGLTGGWVDSDLDDEPPPAAPVVRVRGLAYKGGVAVRTRSARSGSEGPEIRH